MKTLKLLLALFLVAGLLLAGCTQYSAPSGEKQATSGGDAGEPAPTAAGGVSPPRPPPPPPLPAES